MKFIRLTIFTFVSFFANATFGQDILYDFHKDSTLKAIAKNYLDNNLGAEYVAKHLEFVLLSNAGLDVVIYQTKAKQRPDGKNTIFVYFKYLKLEVDSQRSVYDKREIRNSIKGKKCNLLIGIDKAKEIAAKAGLRKGIKPWRIGVVHLATNQIPEWGLCSTDNSSPGGSDGECFNISMIDGTFHQSFWSIAP